MRPTYLCFTKDHNPESARLVFENRYHVSPLEIKLEGGLLWVGPIPGQDSRLFEIIELPGIGHNPDPNDKPLQLVML
jgi:hypothetical protein